MLKIYSHSLIAGLGLVFATLVQPATAQTTLRVVPQSEPTVFDPVTAVAAVTQQHAYMVYDTLFSLDGEGKPQPQMVDTVTPSEGGKVLTMSLRSGLRFHDGTPVRAADAVASIARWAKRDVVGAKLVGLGMKLAAVDDKTFTVTTDVATPLVIEGFAKPTSSALFVMREADAANDPTKAVTANIGSGPFRFVPGQYVSGSRLVYERNPDYVPRAEPASGFAGGKRVLVDRVELAIIGDAATASAALQTGQIDIYESVPLDLLPLFKNDKSIALRALNRSGIAGVFRPNFLHPPFNNQKVRQALMMAFDQAEFMALAAGGDDKAWRSCLSFLACSDSSSLEAGTEAYRKPDLDKAKAMLKDAGYKGEPVVIMQPTNFQLMSDFVEVAASRMRSMGMTVNILPLDWATVLQRRANKGTPAEGGWSAFVTWSYSFELSNPAANFLLNGVCDGTSWFGWPCDQATEDLRNAWMREADPVKRQSLREQLQRRAAEFVPFVPLGQYLSQVAYRSSITGLLDTPVTVFWNVGKP
jgi:peptide/nickel transport system substrate-binding protein